MPVSFQNQNISFRLVAKTKIRQWISLVIQAEKKKQGQINFVFTSDEDLLQTNIQFLNHHDYTDIITFDYSDLPTINGDIIISVERVRDNAKKFGIDFKTEIKRVIIHGILHLCGYKDKRKTDQELMRSRENLALKKYTKL
jgi:probable rRNA maturation factor